MSLGFAPFMNGINSQTYSQFNNRNHRQQDRCLPYPFLKFSIIGMMLKSYFCQTVA